MRKGIVYLNIALISIACQKTIGGYSISVSQKEFSIVATGGTINIITSGARDCKIVDSTKDGDIVHIELDSTTVASYDGGWYYLTSENNGKNIVIKFNDNPDFASRSLSLSLTDGDLYAKVSIEQLGKI